MLTKKLGKAAAILLTLLTITSTVYAASLSSAWPSWGHDLQNTRNQASETKINAANAANLTVKWQFTTGGDVSATPALDGTNAYFPDWAGNLYAVNRKTGALVWSQKISDYTGIACDMSRATPAIAGNSLIFGNQGGYVGGGAYVMAVNKQTGTL